MSDPIEVWPRPHEASHVVRIWDRYAVRALEVIRGVQRSGERLYPIQTGLVAEVLGERGRLVRTEDGQTWRLVEGEEPQWQTVGEEPRRQIRLWIDRAVLTHRRAGDDWISFGRRYNPRVHEPFWLVMHQCLNIHGLEYEFCDNYGDCFELTFSGLQPRPANKGHNREVSDGK